MSNLVEVSMKLTDKTISNVNEILVNSNIGNGASNIIVKSVGKVVSELIKEIGVSIVTPKVITL